MPLEEELLDLQLGVENLRRGAGRRENVIDVGEAGALQPLANGGVGGHDDAVLIVADDIGALGLQHADDLKRDILDAYDLAHRIHGLEKFRDDRVSDDTDLGRRNHVPLGEKTSPAELPIGDGEVARAAADQFARVPIGVAVNDLSRGAHHRRTRHDVVALARDRLAVVGGQRKPATLMHASAPQTAGKHHDHVGAQALKLPLDEIAGALTDGDHGGDGRDADNDPEHRQAGAHFVLPQRTQGHTKGQ